MAEQAAQKAAELRKQRESWMAQRAVAQERQAVRTEMWEDQPDESPATAILQRAVQPSAHDDEFLDRITERITSRLREELRTEVQKEEQEVSRRKAKDAQQLESHLSSELEQTTCPICYELMQAPVNTPTLLFPCGHTFCVQCLESHCKKNHRRTCPYCREKIQSQAPNVLLQQLIEGFAEKKKACAKDMARAPAVVQPEPEQDRSLAVLENCPEGSRASVEEYRREWKMLNMRWKIYENEARDCEKEISQLGSKKASSKLVRKHLSAEMADARHRLLLVQQEIELIEQQVEQQQAKDEQVEADIAEKKRRLQLISSTKEMLGTEREKIRLMLHHYIPDADLDALLDA